MHIMSSQHYLATALMTSADERTSMARLALVRPHMQESALDGLMLTLIALAILVALATSAYVVISELVRIHKARRAPAAPHHLLGDW